MSSGEHIATGADHNRLIVVSNRLPFTVTCDEDGKYQAQPASGGLVSAMVPALRNRGGVWIGWPGIIDGNAHELEAILDELTEDTGYTLLPIILSAEEEHGFYHGFSNEIIWPLFHDLFCNCHFDPNFWKTYLQVNQKFSRAIFNCEALESDISDTQDGTTPEGIHLGAMAGTVDIVLRHYAGIDTSESVIAFHPRLPEQLSSFYTRLIHRGQWYELDIGRDSFQLAVDEGSGETVMVNVNGELHELKLGSSNTFPCN